MSGINEIKQKTKLSIDEMYESQPVGKLDTHQTGNPEKQQTTHPNFQSSVDIDIIRPVYQDSANNKLANAQKMSQTSGDFKEYANVEIGPKEDQKTIFPASKSQAQKIPTFKMTFNLTDGIYKAFNDLYANRMLQGRKTEKSELICEAIQWLIKMENEQAQ